VDEGPAGAAVAVDERVDGLELGMGDRRLRDRWKALVVAKPAEVFEQVSIRG
jgi:hypothetical protein